MEQIRIFVSIQQFLSCTLNALGTRCYPPTNTDNFVLDHNIGTFHTFQIPSRWQFESTETTGSTNQAAFPHERWVLNTASQSVGRPPAARDSRQPGVGDERIGTPDGDRTAERLWVSNPCDGQGRATLPLRSQVFLRWGVNTHPSTAVINLDYFGLPHCNPHHHHTKKSEPEPSFLIQMEMVFTINHGRTLDIS